MPIIIIVIAIIIAQTTNQDGHGQWRRKKTNKQQNSDLNHQGIYISGNLCVRNGAKGLYEDCCHTCMQSAGYRIDLMHSD